jgi:hypothetical protein
MNNKIELYCEKDVDTGYWLVYFPHPLGGIKVLESFDNETDARAFWQEQIDTADWDAE